jgi:hypothetical protein
VKRVTTAIKWAELMVWVVCHYQPCFNKNKGAEMTKEEVLKKLDESDVDYEVTAEHDDGFHIIVKFEKEDA